MLLVEEEEESSSPPTFATLSESIECFRENQKKGKVRTMSFLPFSSKKNVVIK